MQCFKNKYDKSGFNILRWHGDNKFNILDNHQAILLADLEPYARGKHIGFIERSIQDIK